MPQSEKKSMLHAYMHPNKAGVSITLVEDELDSVHISKVVVSPSHLHAVRPLGESSRALSNLPGLSHQPKNGQPHAYAFHEDSSI